MFYHNVSTSLAGDEHVLVTVYHDSGITECDLLNRNDWFYIRRLEKLYKQLESKIRRELLKHYHLKLE